MSIVHQAKRLFSTLGTLCFPPHCAECRAATEPGVYLCADCACGTQRIVAPFCERCSQPFDGALTQRFVCSNCQGREVHFECAVAPYRSFGVVRDFIHAFKYRHQLHLSRPLGEWLAEERNLEADYRHYIGEPPRRVVKIWLIAASVFQGRRGRALYRNFVVEDVKDGRRLAVS